jgi:NAD(P)-dependent dehydrogenase (short-subunit alcohol dehydrogenase family)
VVSAAGLGATQLQPYITPSSAEGGSSEKPTQPTTKVIDVNLTGVYYTTTLALWYFNDRPSSQHPSDGPASFKPQLLLVGSGNSYQPNPFHADYSASKFGVRGLWRSILKPEEGMAKYQANLLAPSFTDTGMIGGEEGVKKLEEMGLRVGSVGDVVEGAMRCVCDGEVEGESSFFGLCLEVVERMLFADGTGVCPGRAVCCVKAFDGQPAGSANFDICDDVEGLLGAREMLTKYQEGRFGKVPGMP